MKTHDICIGNQQIWGGEIPAGISGADRFRHLYVVGQTGTGKSTLLERLMVQDIGGGAGCALIDPHGDLAAAVLAAVPPRRIDDVVVFDPGDVNWPVGFNPFYRVPLDERALVAANLISSFKHIWADSWGPRLEYILLNTILALLDAPDALRPSFLSIPRLLVDRRYAAAVTERVVDPGARRFFTEEFSRWNDRQVSEAISPIQNKIGQLVANPFVRNVLCQWKPTVSIPTIMAQRKVLIVRLPKGTLGEEPAHLVGALLVAGFAQAAMNRPSDGRVPFHLYVDEFQNFTTSAFEMILSEARKFSLSLTIAHQYLDQLPEPTRRAVFGNVGSLVSFRVGARDATVMATEVGHYNEGIFGDLRRGEFVGRLIYDGTVQQPFLGRTDIPVPAGGDAEKVVRQSRRAYGRPRAKVEERIGRWLRAGHF